MNVIGCLFVSCMSALCLNLCRRACSETRQQEENAHLIEKEKERKEKIDEVIETYEHTSPAEIVVCPITQDEILQGSLIKELPCGHKFSEDITKWLVIKNRCPVCREKVVVI